MYRTTALLLFFCFSFPGFSQQQHKLGAFFGLGSHEAIHAGIMYSIDTRNSFYLSYGNFFNFIPKERYWNIALEFERVLRKKSSPQIITPWSFSPKLFYWRLNDSYYYFKVFSLELAAGYNFKLGKLHGLRFDFGPVIMIVEDYHRLTFREAGWPKKFMFNGSVKYYFQF